jgi:hypothetical protein
MASDKIKMGDGVQITLGEANPDFIPKEIDLPSIIEVIEKDHNDTKTRSTEGNRECVPGDSDSPCEQE